MKTLFITVCCFQVLTQRREMLQPWLEVKNHFETFLNVANCCTDHVICVFYPPLPQESSVLCCFSSSASWLRCFGWCPDKKAPTTPTRWTRWRTTMRSQTVLIRLCGWRSLWPSKRRRRSREERGTKDWRVFVWVTEWRESTTSQRCENVLNS